MTLRLNLLRICFRGRDRHHCRFRVKDVTGNFNLASQGKQHRFQFNDLKRRRISLPLEETESGIVRKLNIVKGECPGEGEQKVLSPPSLVRRQQSVVKFNK